MTCRKVCARTQRSAMPLYRPGSAHLPCTVQIDNAPKDRFSATVGEEPEIEVALV